MNPLIQLKKSTPLFLIVFTLGCFGPLPMAQAVGPDTDGAIAGSNNGEGVGVLVSRTTGIWNTGTGFEALNHLTAGNQNTATGLRALFSDTNGGFNTATGVYSLFGNTSGFFNSATGAYTLAHNTTGNSNTANGLSALFNNTTGGDNTADGAQALLSNTTGNDNTANGLNALLNNTTGDNNTAVGRSALSNNTTGNGNTALGVNAGSSLTTGNNNIDIGNSGGPGESDTIRIGESQTKTFIAGIRGVTTGIANAIPVLIDSASQLGTVSSSKRFKKEIKPMDQTSEAILALKPVTFHYKSDKTGTPQFGLIAEEVAEVNPDLVVRDADGETYTVRYDAVNAMLLNEFLKEHRKVEEQEKTIAELKSGMTALAAAVKEQAAQIQKVTAQLEMTKPASRTVVDNR
jgi:hypothetical protein